MTGTFDAEIERVPRARGRGDRPPGEGARHRLRRLPSPLGRRPRGRAAAARLGARDGRQSEIGVELIHYEAALLAALLELDPADLGIPPVEVADTPRRRATAALLEGDLLGAASVLAELGKVSDEAYLRLRAGERLLAEGRRRMRVARRSSERSPSIAASARRGSSPRPSRCWPASNGKRPDGS